MSKECVFEECVGGASTDVDRRGERSPTGGVVSVCLTPLEGTKWCKRCVRPGGRTL